METIFGLSTPADLYGKLLYDIFRLKAATSSGPVIYAAMDCAVTATHIADWVLARADDDTHMRLTGERRGKHVSMHGFNVTQEYRLDALKFCRDIANHSKHLVLTQATPIPGMDTKSTFKFTPPYNPEMGWQRGQAVVTTVHIEANGGRWPVTELFDDMATQWFDFLRSEGMYREDEDD
jgi:hypothetical protein